MRRQSVLGVRVSPAELAKRLGRLVEPLKRMMEELLLHQKCELQPHIFGAVLTR